MLVRRMAIEAEMSLRLYQAGELELAKPSAVSVDEAEGEHFSSRSVYVRVRRASEEMVQRQRRIVPRRNQNGSPDSA